MSYYIVDEKRKSIHNYESVKLNLCKISKAATKDKIIIFDDKKLRDLLLLDDYNGCPYCLKKFYLEKKYLMKK
ncbi:hypothetical protein ACFL2A_02665 [Thermodesulfobacteriota bacterium]